MIAVGIDECQHARAVLLADVRGAVGPWRAWCPECGAEGPERPTDAEAREAWREVLAE